MTTITNPDTDGDGGLDATGTDPSEEQSENGNGNRKTASSGDVRSKSNVSWKMVAPAVPPFSDAYNKTYDWKIWL